MAHVTKIWDVIDLDHPEKPRMRKQLAKVDDLLIALNHYAPGARNECVTSEPAAALADYELAMQFGGTRIVKLYQCGLRSQGLYFGAVDGNYSQAVRNAMHTCANNRACDPLPSDAECKPEVS